MSVPKRRQTSTRGKKRRSHDALRKLQLADCQQCGKPVQPHHACPACGQYKGRTPQSKK